MKRDYWLLLFLAMVLWILLMIFGTGCATQDPIPDHQYLEEVRQQGMQDTMKAKQNSEQEE